MKKKVETKEKVFTARCSKCKCVRGVYAPVEEYTTKAKVDRLRGKCWSCGKTLTIRVI